MYRILGKRGSGKTTNLITLAKETGAILVVSNVDYAVNKMYQLGITGVDIMSYTHAVGQKIHLLVAHLTVRTEIGSKLVRMLV